MAVSTATLAGTAAVVLPGTAGAADPLLSQGRPTTASSTENAGTPASAATDGSTGTRWASAFADPQWLQVDLGSTATITQVVLTWEAAYGRAFQIQTSPDAATWTSVYSTTTGTGGVQTLPVTGSGRYVRLYGTARATGYGYSLYEFQVFGTTGGGTGGPTLPGGGDLGPNVHVYDPSQGTAAVQASVDSVFAAQETAQFGTRRDALLFKPGQYDINVNRGDLNLAPSGYGWASGGYIADSRITGAEGQYFQQQWFTRNSTIGSNTNAV
jgi:hypothetical protein